MGLFLGASLLTIIEIIYLCFQRGACSRKTQDWVREKSIKMQEKGNSWMEQRKSMSKTPSHTSFDNPEKPSQESKTTDEEDPHPDDFEDDKSLLKKPKLASLAKNRKKKREDLPKEQFAEVDETTPNNNLVRLHAWMAYIMDGYIMPCLPMD